MDKQTFQNYEAMAKLCLPEAEREWLLKKIDILEQSFTALSAVDTEGVEPLISVLDMNNVMRDDVTEKLFSRDEMLSNALEQYEGYFQVPKTLE